MKVLIGIDGSELALRAAQRALALVKEDARVVLVAVARPVIGTIGSTAGVAPAIGATPGLVEEATEAAEHEVAGDVAAAARALGVPTETRVLVGDPGDALCRLAAEEGADLLVVGSHGSGLLKRALLGSVSHHVLHHAPCPVLVVREVEGG